MLHDQGSTGGGPYQTPNPGKCPKKESSLEFEIGFTVNDPENPQNWPQWRKCFVLFTMAYGAGIVAFFSTIYTSAIPGLQAEFGISKEIGLLGVTTYLSGMAAGAPTLAPLSELCGRRPIYLLTTAIFLVLIIPCALATNFATVVVIRFFAGFCGAALMTVSRASVGEIVSEEHRALAGCVWSAGPLDGPVIGPILGGFVFQYLGWRWTNWVVLAMGGVAFLLLACVKETYAPAVLQKRALVKRIGTDSLRWQWYDSFMRFKSLLRNSLTRPFVMMFTEPIWCVNLASPVNRRS